MIIRKNRVFSIMTSALLLLASFNAQATLLQSPAKVKAAAAGTQPIHLQFIGKPFVDVANEIEQRSHIKIQMIPSLQNRLITANIQSESWERAIASLLKGYNRIGFVSENGQISRILITGINGNGDDADTIEPTESFISYPDNNLLQNRPEHLKKLPVGSVFRVKFNKAMLKDMAPGDVLPLSLPAGQFNVVHDNIVFDKNGDFTWIGHLEEVTPKSRVIITFNKDTSFGRITTPEGVFRVETSVGVDWMIDVDSAALNPGSLREDTLSKHSNTIEQPGIDGADKADDPPLKPRHPPAYAINIINHAKDLKTATAKLEVIEKTLPGAMTDKTSGAAIIDVMVLYTEGVQTTRINNLIATANQAYKDSNVLIQLRLVHTQRVNYSKNTLNESALYDLSYGRDVFNEVAALRARFGADLVSLVRPFAADTQQGCGLAWIGGSGGRRFNPEEAYSVVSDGIDHFQYCTDYTFVHEISHNMGSSHDRQNARSFGKFPYSYGININGYYGTIMSYATAELGFFSNPDIICLEQSCGIGEEQPNAANNALSLNNSAAAIAAFMKPAQTQSTSITN